MAHVRAGSRHPTRLGRRRPSRSAQSVGRSDSESSASRRTSVRLRLTPIVLALALSGAVVVANRFGDFFRVIAPATDAETWTHDTYQSWWAGTSYWPGLLLYTAFIGFGLYIAILQNFVGILTVRIVASLPQGAEYRVDWLNLDSHYGWEPIRRAYFTIVFSVSIHAVAISVLIFVVGFRISVILLVPLLAFWTIPTVSYLVIIRWVFSDIFEREAKVRLDAIREEYEAGPVPLTTVGAVKRERRWRNLAEGVHSCQFSALVGSRTERRLLTISIALPAILTLIQVFPAFVGR